MNKRLLIIAGGLIVVAVVLFILSRVLFNTNNVQTQTPTTPATTETTTPTPVAFPLSDTQVADLTAQAQKEFDFAFQKAREWRDDTAPIAVVIKYTDSIDIKNGKSTYVFLSPSLAQYYFTLNLDQAKNASGENNYENSLFQG